MSIWSFSPPVLLVLYAIMAGSGAGSTSAE
jgi:hypothetical protein